MSKHAADAASTSVVGRSPATTSPSATRPSDREAVVDLDRESRRPDPSVVRCGSSDPSDRVYEQRRRRDDVVVDLGRESREPPRVDEFRRAHQQAHEIARVLQQRAPDLGDLIAWCAHADDDDLRGLTQCWGPNGFCTDDDEGRSQSTCRRLGLGSRHGRTRVVPVRGGAPARQSRAD